ncbi:MAG: D-alanyl-D-alanine carboxypeptidase [Bacteroidota bacterium]
MPLLFLLCCLSGSVVFAQEPVIHPVHDQLQRLIANNPVFQQGYSGFSLYDPEREEFIYDYRADQRFTPASNVKLLTYYLCTQLLEHEVPALWYEDYGNRLELWGTGYPSWEYLDLVEEPDDSPFGLRGQLVKPGNENPLTNWLYQQGWSVVLHQPTDLPGRYGAGWSYDDWNDGYVYERSSLPLYGNRLKITTDSIGGLVVEPARLADRIALVDRPTGPRLIREEASNYFSLDTSRQLPLDFERSIALRMTPEITEELLIEQIGQPVCIGNRSLPPRSRSLNLVRLPLPDTLFQIMLQQSDNYLAEQLLLLSASSRYDRPDVEAVLSYARDTLLAEIAEPEIQWVDGSGLSRYNQLSPRQLVRVLDLSRQAVGWEKLISLLPANGESGTLERRFVNRRAPFIWAKTGSLRNVIALSGLLRTRSGHQLIFSFLHNHTQEGSSTYYREMEKVFELLYFNY